MAQAAATLITRRSALAGAAALVPTTILPVALAAASPDPVSALIERHRDAYRALVVVTDTFGDIFSTDPSHDAVAAQWDAANSAERDALKAVVECLPTTHAGAKRWIAYLSDHANHEPYFLNFETLDFQVLLCRIWHVASALPAVA